MKGWVRRRTRRMREDFAAPPVAHPPRRCEFAFLGARCDAPELESVVRGHHWGDDLDVALVVDPAVLRAFEAGDRVIALTRGRCSCQLVRGLGDGRGREAHVAGPGYTFRRAIASAALRFGSVRLLLSGPERLPAARPYRETTLSQLLRTGLLPDDALIVINGRA